MALEGWDWFIKLAENENFTKAADELQISQQTLSARLVSLERNLGAKLVVRGTPLSLTSAGQVFLLYAREQRQAQQDMIRQIGEVAGGGAGVLKVGVSHTRGSYLMPKVVRRLSEELPAVSVKLVEDTNRNLLRSAERGEVDVCIVRFEGACPGVEVEPIYEEEIVLAVRADVLSKVMGTDAKAAAATLASNGIGALQKCPFILGSVDDISGRVAYSELRNAGIKPHVVATSGNMPTLLTLCAEGLGAVFCPTDMLDASPMVSGDLLRIPLSSQSRYTIELGIPMRSERWQVVDAFRRILLEVTSAK